jgi:hypothetical protein
MWASVITTISACIGDANAALGYSATTAAATVGKNWPIDARYSASVVIGAARKCLISVENSLG